MKLNLKTLGASLLSAGPLLVQFGGATTAWWLGVAFTALGPLLLAITPAPPPAKRKRPRRRRKIDKARSVS